MSRTYTKEEVQKRLDDLGKEIDIIGEYKDTVTKCLCSCRKDGCEWMVKISDLFNGNGCPRCSNRERLTNEIVDKRLEGRNIKRIDDVKGTGYKIRWQCIIDGHVWQAKPQDVLNIPSGCPRCAGLERLTNEMVDKKLAGRNIKRLDDVNGSKNKIRWQCIIDGHVWQATPQSVLNIMSGCPRCAGLERLTTEMVDKKLAGRNIKRLDDVNGIKNKIRWQCLNDYNTWKATPDSVLNQMCGCPACACSKGNDFIASFLKDNGYQFIREAKFTTCRFKKELPYDFFIPNKRVLIEYDGEQHYEHVSHFHKGKTLEEQIEKDFIKTRWAKNNGYFLIRIAYDMSEQEKIESLSNIRFYKDC